jgi:hypothetical protein
MANESRIEIVGVDNTKSAFASIVRNVDEVNKKVGGLQGSFSNLSSLIKTIGGAAVLTGLTASIGSLVKNAIDLGDELHNLKQRTNVAVESLAGFKLLAEQSDTSLDLIAKGIRKVGQVSLDAARGNETAIDTLKRLNINAKEFSKLSPEQQFNGYITAVRNLREEERALAINDTLGPKFAELATLASMTSQEYDSLIQKGKELYPITTEQAEASANLNDQWDMLSASATNLGISIAGPLVESINLSIARMKEATTAGKTYLQILSAGVSGAFENPIQIKDLNQAKKELDLGKERLGVLNDLIAEEKASIGLSNSSDKSIKSRIKNYEAEKDALKKNLTVYAEYIRNQSEVTKKSEDEDKKPSIFKPEGKQNKPPGLKDSEANKLILEQKRLQDEARKSLESTFTPLEKFNVELDQQFKLYKDGFHTHEEYVRIVEHMSKNLYDSSDAVKVFKDNQKEAQKALQDSLTPAERFQNELSRLNALYKSGNFSLSEYEKVVGKLSTNYIDASQSAKKSFDDTEQYAIQAARNIQSAFADALFNLFTGRNGNFGDQFRNVLSQISSEYISKNVLGSITGSFTQGFTGTNAASSVFDYLGSSNTGKKLGDSFIDTAKKGFSNIFNSSDGVVNSLSKGIKSSFSSLTRLFSGSGAGSAAGASGMAGGLGAVAGPAMAAFVATQVFRGFAGDKKLGGGFGKALNTVGDLPIIGDFIPIVPLLNTLFGRGPYKLKQRNFQGEIESDGDLEARLHDSFKSKGGLFSSSKWKGITKELDSELDAQLESTIKGFKTGIEDIGDVLGLSAQASKEFKTTFDIKLDIKDEEKAKKQIEDLFTSFGDTMTSMVMPTVSEFRKSGETLFETFTRIGTNFKSLVDATVILGRSLVEGRNLINSLGHDNSDALLSNFKSIDEFNQLIQFYEQNFLDASDLLKRKQEELSDSLNKLGLSSTLSREEFKKLIESVDDVGGISKELFAELIKLAPLFDEVTDGVSNAVGALTEASKTLDQLRSDVQTAYDRRSNELKEMKDSFKGIIENLQQFRQSLTQGSLSPLTPGQKLDDARLTLNRTLLAARSGDSDAISKFPEVAQEFLQASQVFNASSAAYQSDFNLIKNLTDEMENLSKNQISDADKELSKLDAQVAHLIDISKGVQSVEDAIIALRNAIIKGNGNSAISDEEIFAVAHNPNLSNAQKVALADKNGLSDSQLLKAIPDLNQSTLDQIRKDAYGSTNISDAQIREFVNANINDPRAIYDASVKNKISRFRLSEVMGWNVSDVEKWVRDNNLAMFERGSDFVPKTGLALLHKNEAVIPSSAVKLISQLIKVVEELKSEQRMQTSDVIQSTVESNMRNAEMIADSAMKVSRSNQYFQNQFKVAGMRG